MNRILMIDYVLFVADIAQDFERRGMKVERIPPRALTMATWHALCAEFSPTFAMSINFSPEIALLCSQANLPYLSWTIDPLPEQRFRLYDGTRPELCRLFCHQSSLAHEFLARGLTAQFLPLAAPPRRRPVADRQCLAPYVCEVSFVGESMRAEKLRACQLFEKAGLSEQELKVLDAWIFQLAEESADSATFAGLRRASVTVEPPVPASVKSEMGGADCLGLLDGWLAHALRLVRLRKLAGQGLDLRIYGDEAWKELEGYRGYARHDDELNFIYNASLLNLDLPRIYQRDVVNMRVFDVLACGGSVATERHAGLSSCFELEEHVFAYANTGELRRLVDRMRTMSPALLEQMRRASRDFVLSHHRLDQRIDVMLAAMAPLF